MFPIRTLLGTRFMTVCLIVLFGLCQAAGILCPPQDLMLQDSVAFASDDPMTCPMPGGLVCQPQLASSHGRDGEDGQAIHYLDPQSQIVHIGITIAPAISGNPSTVPSEVLPSVITQSVSLTVLRI